MAMISSRLLRSIRPLGCRRRGGRGGRVVGTGEFYHFYPAIIHQISRGRICSTTHGTDTSALVS